MNEISRQRKKAHQRLLTLKSRVYESFLQMEQATYADGALPRKIKELIAAGISVQTDCESCMQWPIDQAAACGATPQEILEAVEIAMEMGAGRVTVSARFAPDVMERPCRRSRRCRSQARAGWPCARRCSDDADRRGWRRRSRTTSDCETRCARDSGSMSTLRGGGILGFVEAPPAEDDECGEGKDQDGGSHQDGGQQGDHAGDEGAPEFEAGQQRIGDAARGGG